MTPEKDDYTSSLLTDDLIPFGTAVMLIRTVTGEMIILTDPDLFPTVEKSRLLKVADLDSVRAMIGQVHADLERDFLTSALKPAESAEASVSSRITQRLLERKGNDDVR